jgi:hypothetical protein
MSLPSKLKPKLILSQKNFKFTKVKEYLSSVVKELLKNLIQDGLLMNFIALP